MFVERAETQTKERRTDIKIFRNNGNEAVRTAGFQDYL